MKLKLKNRDQRGPVSMIPRGTANRRIILVKRDENTGRSLELHATKGWRSYSR